MAGSLYAHAGRSGSKASGSKASSLIRAHHARAFLMVILEVEGEFNIISALDLKLDGQDARMRHNEGEAELTTRLNRHGIARPR